jgi:hypothetical protein
MEYKGNSGQEEFALHLLNYKKNGYYVELGAFDSKLGSNTYHLETGYDWNGVSFEIVPERHAEFVSNRKNPCILGDATQFNYISYFEENNFPKQIDYLQVDIDAGYTPQGNSVGNPFLSLHGLLALPLSKYRFSVITFEHDAQIEYGNRIMKDVQREVLTSLGYKLVVRDYHEDWWVDPKVIPYLEFRERFSFRGI